MSDTIVIREGEVASLEYLATLARELRVGGAGAATITAALHAANAESCSPPLSAGTVLGVLSGDVFVEDTNFEYRVWQEKEKLRVRREAQRRLEADEFQGHPSLLLRDVVLDRNDTFYDVQGLRLPQRHSAIVFGDGDTLKSYMALHIAGTLQARGINVGYFDWELDPFEHRRRFGQLFGTAMSAVRYVRCDRPLVHEVDHLLKIVKDDELQYAVVDSIAFATHGAPESAEAASEFFRAWRQLGIGGLHIAHITKGENGDQKPFGSVFWHNGARATWFVKRAEGSLGNQVTIGLYSRKFNLGAPPAPALAFEVMFSGDATIIRPVNAVDVADLAAGLPAWKRIQVHLKNGAQPIQSIAEALGMKPDSVKKALVRQKGKVFVAIIDDEDGIQRWGLVKGTCP